MDFTPRRVLLFLLTSALVLVSWRVFVLDRYEAQRKAALEQAAAEDRESKPDEKTDDLAKTEKSEKKTSPVDGPRADNPSVAITEKPKPQPAETPEEPEVVAEAKPEKQSEEPIVSPNSDEVVTATLGSLDPESGYYFQAELSSIGASVAQLELNDPRYRDLEDPDAPLSLIQVIPPEGTPGPHYRTFSTAFFQLIKTEDKEGNEKSKRQRIIADNVNWTLLSQDENRVTFQYVVPQKFRFTKEYSLANSGGDREALNQERQTNALGYFLKLKIGVENLQDDVAEVVYEMQGPVGLPLEDAESTSKYRDIKIGALEGGSIEHRTLTVKDLADSIEDQELENPPYYYEEEWKAPFRYVGVDGQFFATLLYNSPEDPATSQEIESYTAEVVDWNVRNPQHSDVSLNFTSVPITVPAGEQTTHDYTLFAGPKRQVLLSAIEAGEIIEFGWFGWISKGLLAILAFLHNNLYLPYGLAIVCLTIMVRGALFPLSKKQAHSAARMKELQPKLQELKKKYGDDKQKFAEAQMKLFRDAGYNPFAGCLPMILQLPIFIGLYGAIRHAIDLRAAEFLWVDNLAAPDHLFQLPFRIWWVGQYFNLLPILTVFLFLAQQKMFMPTPDPDDEQAVMQQKMMNFMMVFMGFLFYHMPAGLCIYFIASSLWGMGERKLLDLGKKTDSEGEDPHMVTTAKDTKIGTQTAREKRTNTASQKRGKKSSKSRR